MFRKMFVIGATAVAIIAGGSALSTRANAIPVGIPVIDHLNITEAVALCFYFDGWNGPGMYQCGYRSRRGMGWHGPRNGGGRHLMNRGGGRHMMNRGGGRPAMNRSGGHSGGGKRHR